MAEMDLTTYTGLKAALASYANRSDLTDQIPSFITLAEGEMRRKLRRTVKRKSIVLVGSAVPVPVDVGEVESLRLDTSAAYRDKPLREVTPEMLAEVRARRGDVAGRPTHFAIIGTEIVFAPKADALYDAEVVYIEKLPALSATVVTNSVLKEAPAAYLYGTQKEIERFLENDERIDSLQTAFDKVIDELNIVREREEYSASPRPVRLPVVFG